MINKDKAIKLAREQAISRGLYWHNDGLIVSHNNIKGEPCWLITVVNNAELTLSQMGMTFFISMVTGKLVGERGLR